MRAGVGVLASPAGGRRKWKGGPAGRLYHEVMDAISWVLLVMLVGVVGVSAWLIARLSAERGRWQARAEQATAGAEELRRSVAAAEERVRQGESRTVAAEGREKQASEQLRTTQDRERQTASLLADERAKSARLEQSVEGVRKEAQARLDAALDAKNKIEQSLADLTQRMEQAFGALAAKALTQNSGEFLKLAEQKLAAKGSESVAEMDKRREAVENMVKPIAESLKKTEERLGAFDRSRSENETRLIEQVRQVSSSGMELRAETARLVRALREPHVRGRYGEMQLRRVAELAGMKPYCDFVEQSSTVDSEGNTLRPDMVVKLPNGRELVIDAKANLQPYLDAIEATDDDERESHLRRFADGIVKQAQALAKKEYFRNHEGSPDFVVMFVPGDAFVDAALSKRPDLLEIAASQRVLMASPSTLIAMLRAVAVGFAEQKLTQEADQIRKLAVELHDRAAVMLDHLAKLGASLNSSVERFNSLTGSVEKRIMPTLRRIESSGAGSAKTLNEPEEIVVRPREIEGVRPSIGTNGVGESS